MAFARRLISWHARHGRRGLPWQGTRDPYRIWLSEVMLQQTQVAAVIPYYERFLRKYPTVKALAAASEDEVLQLWSGLGYYARGRNLHRASRKIAFELGGKFPDSAARLGQLPGIGRSTAAAIAAFAFGERAAILDGNVKRVLARHFLVEDPKDLWPLAESLLPKKGIETYTQALMDLGATVCVKGQPRCGICPVSRSCLARKENRIPEFPGARPKKALPLRETTWLLLVHKGKILLQRRPSRGLWGGLLTFPEAAVKGCEVASRRKLPVVEHGFTHFRLRAQPVLCAVAKAKRRIPGCVWVSLSKVGLGAVPAPVRQLLIGL
jgi:A/G-specific adenine glycosylase